MKSPIKPQNPVDFAVALTATVLGLAAAIDGLVKSGSGSEFVVFPNFDRGLNADCRLTYDKSAPTCAQKRTTYRLRERGV